jgi:hypothetical protein
MARLPWGVALAIFILLCFYSEGVFLVIRFLAGLSGWLLAWVDATWRSFIRLLSVILLVTAAMSAWCGHRTYVAVRKSDGKGAHRTWDPKSGSGFVSLRHALAVTFSILLELLVPIALIVAFLVALQAAVHLLALEESWSTFISEMAKTLARVSDETPDQIYSDVASALGRVKDPVQQSLNRSIGVVSGAVSGAISLVVLLARRRRNNLNAAKVILAEVDILVEYAFNAVPNTLAKRATIATRSTGELAHWSSLGATLSSFRPEHWSSNPTAVRSSAAHGRVLPSGPVTQCRLQCNPHNCIRPSQRREAVRVATVPS